jgi:hypothetical protein
VIGQVGILTSYTQHVVTHLIPFVVTALQTYLERKRAY